MEQKLRYSFWTGFGTSAHKARLHGIYATNHEVFMSFRSTILSIGLMCAAVPALAQGVDEKIVNTSRIAFNHSTGKQVLAACVAKDPFCMAYVAGVVDAVGDLKANGSRVPELCTDVPIEEKVAAVVSFGRAHPAEVEKLVGSGLVIIANTRDNMVCPQRK